MRMARLGDPRRLCQSIYRIVRLCSPLKRHKRASLEAQKQLEAMRLPYDSSMIYMP